MLESIERLRNFLKGTQLWRSVDFRLDAIEREISERYMLLPVDADGVPIRVGEEVKFIDAETDETLVVMSLVDEKSFRFKGSSIPALGIDVRHVKQRTVEDVLCDVWNEALDYAKSDIWRDPSEVFAERADEIRGMLNGDV